MRKTALPAAATARAATSRTMRVCTDLVWRALANTGYSIRKIVDAVIKANAELYPRVEDEPDPNINF